MTTAQATPGGDWFKPQQQFWEQLFQGQRQNWADLLKEWQGNVGGGRDSLPGADLYQKFFADAGRQFLDMLQQFQKGAGVNASPDATAQEWLSGLQQFFGRIVQGENAAETLKGYTALSESMMKAGTAWASAFQGNAASFANDPQGFASLNLDPFGFASSMPGIGYTREKQEAYAELYRRWAAFERINAKYNASMAKVGIEAVQKFQEYLLNPPKDAAPLTSLKAIYVKWVDVCEDIYARYAMTPEYTGLYGEVVNALMAFKQQKSRLADSLLDELGLPTRQELDSLHQRVHELRRDNIALKKAVFGETKPAKPKPAAGKKKKK